MPNQQFTDKIGSINVEATGDVLLESGSGNFVSTAIGSRESNDWSRSAENGGQQFLGDVKVSSSAGNVILDGSAGGENYVRDPDGDLTDRANFGVSRYNPVAIGHGGSFNLNNVYGEGDISVSSALDTTLIAGSGALGSFTQIGHGYFDPETSPTGEKFRGNIDVNVGGNLTLTANGSRPDIANFDASNAAHVAMLRANGGVPDGVTPPDTDPATPPTSFDVIGANATIGHGGINVEGNMTGEINVNVDGDLTMVSARRDATDQEDSVLGGPTQNFLGITQIGHHAPDAGDVVPDGTTGAFSGTTINANLVGDINVQVGGDFTQLGGASAGTNAGADSATALPVVLGYSQVGHGGIDTHGDKDGTIDITVGGDYTGTDGQYAPGNQAGNADNNNYVTIGHGDWERTPAVERFSGFALNPGAGARTGDIFVKVGESATLDQVLVGHADFNTQSSLSTIGAGNTYFGVSRNNPFQSTGTGELVARNGTVFSSAFYGFGSELRVYIPRRELNKIEQDTTLNNTAYASGTPGETSSGSGGVSFVAPFPIAGETSGRADELYLNPDLWLQAATGGGGGVDFVVADPTQQGSVAAVADPGDLPNLTGVTDNAQLGSNTGTYVGGNGQVNGVTNYTIYYDAIGVFSPSIGGGGGGGGGGAVGGGVEVIVPEILPFIPTPEEPIVIITPFTPFNFLPFVDLFKFEQSDQQSGVIGDLIEGDAVDGGGSVAGTDDGEDEEENRKRSRYAKQVDNWNTFYQYELSIGKYSSFRLFGIPGALAR